MPYAIVIMPCARRLIAEARDWWNLNRAAAPALLGDELDRAFNASPKIPTSALPRSPLDVPAGTHLEIKHLGR
jgi:hypothetical protein